MLPSRRLHGMPMMPLYQFPTPEDAPKGKGSSSGLCHRSNFLRENLFKKVEHALAVEKLIWLVVVKIRLAQILHIFYIIVVQFDDFFNERLVAGKVGPVQEAARVELLVDVGVAPINRQTARHHRLVDFFCGVTGQRPVFKRDVEFVLTQKLNLAACSAGNRAANVVEPSPAGIHPLILGEFLEEGNPIMVFAWIVTANDEAAEFFLCRQDFLQIVVFLDNFFRLAISNIEWQLQMPRVVQFDRRNGVVALVEIRKIRLARIENSYTRMQAMLVPVRGVNQEIRLVVQFHVKPLRQ